MQAVQEQIRSPADSAEREKPVVAVPQPSSSSASWLKSDPSKDGLEQLSLPQLARELREKYQEIRYAPEARRRAKISAPAANLEETVIYIEKLSGQSRISRQDLGRNYGMTGENRINLLADERIAFKSMIDDIKKAESFVHISFYIFSNDLMGKAMENAVKKAISNGAEVRIQIDGYGSRLWSPFNKNHAIVKRLRELGADVVVNSPVSLPFTINRPDHRKLCIIDGQKAYSGGMNIIDDYTRHRFSRRLLERFERILGRQKDSEEIPAAKEHHDIMFVTQGPVVAQMHAEWCHYWMKLGGKLPVENLRSKYFPPAAPAEKEEHTARARVTQTIPTVHHENLQVTLDLINRAKTSINITSPYMTHKDTERALIAAAERGVQVNIVLPYFNNKNWIYYLSRGSYPDLMKAGCKIFEYSGLNHGKVMVVDELRTSIGSANHDYLSARSIYDLNLLIEDERFAKSCVVQVFNLDTFPTVAERVKLEQVTSLHRVYGRLASLLRWIS